MKYTSNQYAKSLFLSLKETPAEDKDAILTGFLKILRIKKDMRKFLFIEEQLKKIFFEESKEKEANVLTAMPVSLEIKERIKEKISDLFKENSEKIKFIYNVDQNIIGGFKIKFGDYLIDGSIKNALMKLKKKMVAN